MFLNSNISKKQFKMIGFHWGFLFMVDTEILVSLQLVFGKDWKRLETERQKYRETERQREERQRDRETERQRDRETERQRDRETERLLFLD